MHKLYIVMYYYVRDLENSRYPKIKGLKHDLFKKQMEFFKQNFNVITMEEAIAAYYESYEIPEDSMLLTFDDGYIDHYTFVYPVLKAYHMQGTFFVPGKTFTENKVLDVNKIHFILASTPIEVLMKDLFKYLDYYRGRTFDYPSNKELFEEFAVANRFDPKEVIFLKRILQVVLPEALRNEITQKLFEKRVGVDESVLSRELYMNYDQIKCMKNDGMFIGYHGYDHYWNNKLTPLELKNDVRKGLTCLEGLYDPSAWIMSYPYGSYNDDVISYVSGIGCKLGFTTDLGVCTIDSEKLRLPRLDTNDFPPKSRNFVKYREQAV